MPGVQRGAKGSQSTAAPGPQISSMFQAPPKVSIGIPPEMILDTVVFNIFIIKKLHMHI